MEFATALIFITLIVCITVIVIKSEYGDEELNKERAENSFLRGRIEELYRENSSLKEQHERILLSNRPNY